MLRVHCLTGIISSGVGWGAGRQLLFSTGTLYSVQTVYRILNKWRGVEGCGSGAHQAVKCAVFSDL